MNVVFTTKQNGASEILDDKYIMKTPDDLSILNVINALFDDKAMLEKVKRDNRILSKKFSIEKNLHETLEIINEAIN